MNMSVRSRTVLLALCIFLAGYSLGSVQRRPASAAGSEGDAQIQAAKTYLDALEHKDWPRLLSVASGYVWSTSLLDKYIGKRATGMYELCRVSPLLKDAKNIRLGPVISREYIANAAAYELGDSSDTPLAKGTWPDAPEKSRAVLYDFNGKTYFLFVVWENGGWRVFGTPLRTKASWLEYKTYREGIHADMPDEELPCPEK